MIIAIILLIVVIGVGKYMIKISKENALDRSVDLLDWKNIKIIATRRYAENGYITVEDDDGNRQELFVRIEKGPISTFQPGDVAKIKFKDGQLLEIERPQ